MATLVDKPITDPVLRTYACSRSQHDWTLRLDPRGYRFAVWICRAGCGVDERPLVTSTVSR